MNHFRLVQCHGCNSVRKTKGNCTYLVTIAINALIWEEEIGLKYSELTVGSSLLLVC